MFSRPGLERQSSAETCSAIGTRSATLLFAQGVHPKTVMEILGHGDLNTTMRIYGHVLDQMKREAAGKMDELFGVATRVATKRPQEAAVN